MKIKENIILRISLYKSNIKVRQYKSIKTKLILSFTLIIIMISSFILLPLYLYQKPIDQYDSILQNIVRYNNMAEYSNEIISIVNIYSRTRISLEIEKYNEQVKKLNLAVLQLKDNDLNEVASENSNKLITDINNYIKFTKEIFKQKSIDMFQNVEDAKILNMQINEQIKELESLEIEKNKNFRSEVGLLIKFTNSTSIIGVIVILVFGIICTVLISNSIIRPIRKLIYQMQLVENGDLNAIINEESQDEIGLLGKSFNSMVRGLEQANTELTAHQEELIGVTEDLKESQENLINLNKSLTQSNQETEKAYQELKQTHIQLIQQEKMASLGMLVAGIAHEINTPLGAVNCNIDLYKLLLEQLKSCPPIAEDENILKKINKLNEVNKTSVLACERIVKIVKSLRSFARLDNDEHMTDSDIHFGIDNTLILLQHKIKNRIEIIKDYGQLPNIMCYPNQLNQVFMNLLNNAADAIEDIGTIQIKTYIENNYVFIKIIDGGTGIKPEHLKRIFDPGFTTKGVGVGTGLGLSIVYNIIEKHNGKIEAKSEYGKGTEFTIQIPVNQPLNDENKS